MTAEETIVATKPQEAAVKKSAYKGADTYFTEFDFSKVEITLESMLKSGVHFGHMKSRRHPKMDEYIYTTRNNINIIDLQKTLEKLQEAMKFLSSVQKEGKKVLFVGTKKQANDLIIIGAPIGSSLCCGALDWRHIYKF